MNIVTRIIRLNALITGLTALHNNAVATASGFWDCYENEEWYREGDALRLARYRTLASKFRAIESRLYERLIRAEYALTAILDSEQDQHIAERFEETLPLETIRGARGLGKLLVESTLSPYLEPDRGGDAKGNRFRRTMRTRAGRRASRLLLQEALRAA